MIPHDVKTINTAWAVVLLIVAPSMLIELSVDHAIRSQPSDTAPERVVGLREAFEKQFSDSVAVLRSTLFTAFVVVAGAIVAAVLSGALLRVCSIAKTPAWNAWLQYGGIGVLLWATLGRVDSLIQTWDGGTLPERVDHWLYRSLYVLGSYALVLSVTW